VGNADWIGSRSGSTCGKVFSDGMLIEASPAAPRARGARRPPSAGAPRRPPSA
jgi:hypothetical protein